MTRWTKRTLVPLTLGIAVALLWAPLASAGDREKRARDANPGKGVEYQVGTAKGPACQVDVLAESFDAGIPGTWTTIDNEGDGIVWTTNDQILDAGVPRGNYTACGAGTLAAMVDSDALGGNLEYDAELITPVVDLSGFSNVSINAEINYQQIGATDFLDIDVSTDGGGSWTNVLSWNEDHPVGGLYTAPGETVNLDVSALLDGQANARVRFHYYDTATNDFNWYAQVDCFSITACPSDGACCLNQAGTQTECAILPQAECEANHHIFLGGGTDCSNVDCQALTATIDWMSATATPEGVMVEWQTALEVDTAGFRVLRETANGREKRVAVVAEMIPSMSNGLEGASYMVLDDSAESSAATAYFIEDINIFGKVTRHPAIQIDRGSRETPRARTGR